MRLSLYSLCAVACLALLLFWAKPAITATATSAEAGTGGAVPAMPRQCQPGKTSPEAMGWRWKPGTLVRVYYLKDNFRATEREALSRAVNNWNEALKEIDSQIVLLIGGESASVAPDVTSITVIRGVPKGKERVGEIKLHSVSNGRAHLVVVVSPEVTGLDALTSLMTHELGHSMGLADCYECRQGTTAMAAFRSNNRGNDVYEPSECDRYVVAAGYAGRAGEQARVVSLEQR